MKGSASREANRPSDLGIGCGPAPRRATVAVRPLESLARWQASGRRNPGGREHRRVGFEYRTRHADAADLRIDHMPIWTPDGKRVTFGSNRAGAMDIYWTLADGSEPEIALLTAPLAQWPTSWSPDGRRLAYTEEDPTTGFDIWVLTLQGERRPFLRTPFDERTASFSPDGSWLAYVSNESSRDEIYVRPYSGTGQKFQISTEGGTEPVWARSGLELFYRNGDRMMSVAVSANPTFRAEKPKLLFEGGYERAGPLTSYDVAADGQRFAMIRSEAQLAPSPITVVLNWFEELKAKVPVR